MWRDQENTFTINNTGNKKNGFDFPAYQADLNFGFPASNLDLPPTDVPMLVLND